MKENICQIGKHYKYIDLNNTCLQEEEKKLWTCYLGTKKLLVRDEIGTCPNIEVQIDVTDKSPFFNRPYHVKRGR